MQEVHSHISILGNVMLVKIDKLKGMGVFSEFKWDNTVASFKRFNVIYGNNGTGKTTLSRFLHTLQVGEHGDHPQLEYKLTSATGDCINGSPSNKDIRVFNSDYVNVNIGQLEGTLKPILVVGEENKALAEEIAKQTAHLKLRNDGIREKEKQRDTLQSNKNKVFTGIAKVISESSVGSAVRNYRRNNAETAFSKLEKGDLLAQSALTEHRATIQQEQMDKIQVLELPCFAHSIDEKKFERSFDEYQATARALCQSSAGSAVIARLQKMPDIATWIESGIKIHKEHNSSCCEFCGAAVSKARWHELENHFNIADQILKTELEDLSRKITEARKLIQLLSLPNRAQLYSELRSSFDSLKDEFVQAQDNFLVACSSLEATIQLKINDRNNPQQVNIEIAPTLNAIADCVKKLTELFNKHNQKTDQFDTAKNHAVHEIETHHLRSIQAEIQSFDAQLKTAEDAITLLHEGDKEKNELNLEDLGNDIITKKKAISNAHKAGERLSSLLKTFLGRDDLQFSSEDEGYSIFRSGKRAKRLSEGERTAVAFIYFIVQLEGQDFNKNDGIVVIDDPISSLDANSIYQAFAFLKNAIQDVKQVFLLTHNHGFLRLVLNWLGSVNILKNNSQYYMLICNTENQQRTTKINNLDKLLIDHPTEYHYLFKLLAEFQSDGTISNCYHIPNTVRKVLETFLDFYQPSKDTVYKKLSKLNFDENKKTSIYKFSNDLSHFTGQGFEPGLVIESQKSVSYLLELIKKMSNSHYEGMMNTIGKPL